MLVREMHKNGVPIVAGTDASDEAYVFPGFGLHDELELLVTAGMTPADALRAATINAARAVGQDSTSGMIAAGRLADLVLLDANPLADIRNTQKIRAVILNGRHLDRAALDALLKDVEKMARSGSN
jgi:imidazolonepropionase-like amidohydrolase